MHSVIDGFLERNLPKFKDDIVVTIEKAETDEFKITFKEGKLFVWATSIVAACHGIYCYLKKYCNVQLSWCANTEISIDKLASFDGEYCKKTEQKWRVYMNYCTLNYTASWWDFDRWEKEIDFMAMNGINMPLCVVGTEAVWFETLLELGFSEDEALSTISGPGFWAWQLMTNIEGYIPPKNKKYVYERHALGKKILDRVTEFGMQPIQQGFSGHVPALMKEKFPDSRIIMQKGWCTYPKTAQVDPLDDLFKKFGTTYLQKMDSLFGNHHYIACDPFHEGTPPIKTKEYLTSVGKTINDMYYSFDNKSVWVMQAWTPHDEIILAVPKDRLLLLDLDSDRSNEKNKYFYGYQVVGGMLHNFGGKNAMQGRLKFHCKNRYLSLKEKGANVVGSGMFMEGIEQNPVIYDLQFTVLTEQGIIDFDSWLKDYITRRYGKYTDGMKEVWDILVQTCYKEDGYEENRVGSCLASRPALLPTMTGPCCYTKPHYDIELFETAVSKMLSLADIYGDNDAYQYDLCDIVRQAMSNRFYSNQVKFKKAYRLRQLKKIKEIAKEQLELLLDLDDYLGNRNETTLSRWINDAHKLATDEEERKYFDYNARLLITSWGDVRSTTSQLYDYAWREWNGLIKEYYYVRWEMFYNEIINNMSRFRHTKLPSTKIYGGRNEYLKYPLGRKMDEFEQKWFDIYSEYPVVENKDVVEPSKKIAERWFK